MSLGILLGQRNYCHAIRGVRTRLRASGLAVSRPIMCGCVLSEGLTAFELSDMTYDWSIRTSSHLPMLEPLGCFRAGDIAELILHRPHHLLETCLSLLTICDHFYLQSGWKCRKSNLNTEASRVATHYHSHGCLVITPETGNN